MNETADPWAAARALADQQGGVLSRRQLYAAGLTRWQVKRGSSGRPMGDASPTSRSASATGPSRSFAEWWAAVFQGGPRACLDGASALVAGGLEQFSV